MPDREPKNTETQAEHEVLLGQQIVELYRAWDKYEEKFMGDEVDGTDFDLVHKDFEKVSVNSRGEIIARLETLSQQIAPTTPNLDFFKAKLISSSTYLRALEGEQFSLEEYCQRTIGITPEIVSSENIQRQQAKVNEHLVRLGYDSTPQGLAKFFDENLLDEEEAINNFNAAKDKFIQPITSTLNLAHLLPLKYTPYIDHKAAAWICWIKGKREDVEFRMNFHPRNQQRWFRGNPELLAIHEMGGHLVQALELKDRIGQDLLNPGYGVTSLPGPEQWAFEGIADAIPYFMPGIYEDISDYGKFALEQVHFKELVFQNAHIMANRNTPTSEIIEYIHSYLPHEDSNTIAEECIDRTKPLFRSHFLTYSDCGRYFRQITPQLGDKTIQLTKELFQTPMTPTMVKSYIQHLQVA